MLERENLPRAAHTGTGLEVAVKSPVQLAGNPTLACQEFKENKGNYVAKSALPLEH